MTEPLLRISNLKGWYGESQALQGMDIDVHRGELVTLLGRNGAGKTSTLRAIMGLLRKRQGSVRYDGRELIGASTEQIARAGIAYCPEERAIFSSLSVAENLLLPPVIAEGGMSTEEILEMFPNLRARWTSQGTKLSGGEQQMLAIGRGLMGGPKLLLLDEPSLGLAPLLVRRVFDRLAVIGKENALSIVLVEQNLQMTMRLADHIHFLRSGRIVGRKERAELMTAEARQQVIDAYLGAAAHEEA